MMLLLIVSLVAVVAARFGLRELAKVLDDFCDP